MAEDRCEDCGGEMIERSIRATCAYHIEYIDKDNNLFLEFRYFEPEVTEGMIFEELSNEERKVNRIKYLYDDND